MARVSFNLQDLLNDCASSSGYYHLDKKTLGLRIVVPEALKSRYPYNASAYVLMQELRTAVFDYGIVEFPELAVNKCNHTVAMRHPSEHSYSDNPYLNSFFQSPHQDTPPYPSAFWLDKKRQFAATWTMSLEGLRCFNESIAQQPTLTLSERHRQLIPSLVTQQQSLLLNTQPCLTLLDNSEHWQLYHARTCLFDAVASQPNTHHDTAVYAYNEIGLLNYIDQLDSRRGMADRDADDLQDMNTFMQHEALN